jgi:hypothetical protein
VCEVKSGESYDLGKIAEQAGLLSALRRIGFLPRESEAEVQAIERLVHHRTYSSNGFALAKLIIAPRGLPVLGGKWVFLSLEEAFEFVVGRLQEYVRKDTDKIRFPSEVIQLLAWRAARLSGADASN